MFFENLVSKARARESFNHLRFPILNSGPDKTLEAQKVLKHPAEQGFESPVHLVN